MNLRYFPVNPLPEDYANYSSNITAEGIDFKHIKYKKPAVWIETGSKSNYGSVQESEKDFLTLHGYKRTSENPDVIIDVEFIKPKTINKKLHTRECTFFQNNQKIKTTCFHTT